MKNPEKPLAFSKLLMHWHEKYNKRMMPWKREKDPYKIWLSEIILQQTRVEQGMNYYTRFINKYPTVQQLAAAPDNEVFKLWEGLGYYSRCKNLLAAARFISTEYDGNFPQTFEEILKLKGVGPYTASAIASFAYNLPFAVVDGNVNRLLARFFGIKTPIDSTEGKKQFATLAQKALDKKNAGLYNQAIMDFGATVCKPQLPLCKICILQKNCVAFANNIVNELPVKEKKMLKKARWFYYIVAEHNGKMLVRKRMQKDIWQNLHEFYLAETDHRLDPDQLLATIAPALGGETNFKILHFSEPRRQQLTHQTIHAVFIHVKLKKKMVPAGMELLGKEIVDQLAFPRLINQYMQESPLVKAPASNFISMGLKY